MHQTPDTSVPDDVDGLWVSVSALASQKGLTKQTVSEKVARLVEQGLLTTRPGKGKAKLVNVAQYDRVTGDTADLSKEQGARTKKADDDAAGRDPTFSREQARRAGYEAELKRLDLEERLGKLRSVEDIVAATIACGEVVVREVDQLVTRADDIAAAVAKDGVLGARAALKHLTFNMRKAIEAAFTKMAAAADVPDTETDRELPQ